LESNSNIPDISLEDIYEFIEKGKLEKAPPGLADYMEQMEKVRSMHYRFDKYGTKEAIIDHLVKVDGLTHYIASKLYFTTIEYFFLNHQLTKEAWLMKVASDQEMDIAVARTIAQDTNDYAKISKMRRDLMEIIKEAIPEASPFEAGSFDRPIKIYTQVPEDVGLPTANRTELSEWIDENLSPLPTVVIERIKAEAGIIPGRLLVAPKNDPRAQ
jgi:hypothetical protein